MQPWAELITTERVIELHAAGIEAHGGADIRRDVDDCVEAALGAALSAELYLENPRHSIPGLIFASYLLMYLVKRHCFVDGNKRAAWLAATDVLAAKGLGVVAKDDEAFTFVDAVIAGTAGSGEDIAAWFARRLYALS